MLTICVKLHDRVVRMAQCVFHARSKCRREPCVDWEVNTVESIFGDNARGPIVRSVVDNEVVDLWAFFNEFRDCVLEAFFFVERRDYGEDSHLLRLLRICGLSVWLQ